MLAFDADSAAARQRIDDAQEHVTRELQRAGSAQRYWERQGDAAAAQEEQALIAALVAQQGERAHELTELLAFVQTERKRLVEKSNALLHERTRLTVGSGNSAVPR
jgi:DNA transposition AAA+ family ATPase